MMPIDSQVTVVKFPVAFQYSYKVGAKLQKRNFNIEIINPPLLSLINAAALGSRVYELMTITRPGDCLHYLQVKVCDLDVEVIKHVKDYIKNESWIFDTNLPLVFVAFTDFDPCFQMVEDNQVFEQYWHGTIDGDYDNAWQIQLNSIFAEVLAVQVALREKDDFLIQHEIKLIDARNHCNDRLAHVPRMNNFDVNLLTYKPESQVFYDFVETLIAQKEIKSVSCPFHDFYLWRILVKQQVKRSIHTQLAPQDAFYLCSKDVDFDGATSPTNWGGYADIPYMGMAPADCVFLPDWRKFFYEYAGANGSLANATRLYCKFLFSARDLGDLGCAHRKKVGNWFFYQNKVDENNSDD